MTKDTTAQEARYRSAGISGAAPLVPVSEEPAGFARRAGRAFVGWLKTASITLGVMYVLAWGGITLGILGMNMKYARHWSGVNTAQKGVIAEVARPFVLPPDPRITADEAGRAYVAVLPVERPSADFPRPVVENRSDAPWRGELMAPEVFGGVRASNWNGPSSTGILEAAAKGLTSRQMAVLREYALAPIWKDFDLVVQAPAVDLMGARFQVPFRENARVYSMPVLKFAATKEMAYAGVSRAAFHLAEGRRAEAERILRGVISYGFVLKDNASTRIDELMGDVIVGIGRDGLTRYYDIVKDPRGAELAAAYERARAGEIPSPGPAWIDAPGDTPEKRARLIEIIGSPEASRALRFEALNALSYTTCGNLREFVAGPGEEVKAAFDEARRTLVRHPSDRALIDLIERSGPGSAPFDEAYGIPTRVLDVAHVGDKFFLNPRLTTCVIRGLGGY